MDKNEVTALRARLWDNGWRPVAVTNYDDTRNSPGKRPSGKNWQRDALANPPWSAAHPAVESALNTGILAVGLRVLDIDVEDRETVGRLVVLAEKKLGKTPMRYRANSARCLLVYRAAEGKPKKESLSGTAGTVEVLGAGQQFVAYGQHHTGAPLLWTQGLDEVSVDSVCVVTRADITEFLNAAAEIIGAAPRPLVRQGPKTTESGGVTGRFTLVRGIPARACAR